VHERVQMCVCDRVRGPGMQDADICSAAAAAAAATAAAGRSYARLYAAIQCRCVCSHKSVGGQRLVVLRLTQEGRV